MPDDLPGGATPAVADEPDLTPESSATVAEVLERLRDGVRQRQGELACLDQQRGELPAYLAAVARDAVLEEPTFRTEGVSALRSLIERTAYVLFARRQHRSLLRQQNRFNKSVELALTELHRRQLALSDQFRRAAADRGGRGDADTTDVASPGAARGRGTASA